MASETPTLFGVVDNLIEKDKKGKILELLAAGADINERNDTRETPLHRAAVYSSVDAIRVLLAKGADIHARDEAGKTVLHRAALFGEIEDMRSTVEALVAAGLDINTPDDSGAAPLFMAAGRGEADLVGIFLGFGADPNAQLNQTSALQIAATGKHTETTRLLLQNGADSSWFHDETNTMRRLILEDGEPEIIRLLRSPPKTKKTGDHKWWQFWKSPAPDIASELESPAPVELMTFDSPRLFKGDIPEICFVCAPFGGSAPADLDDWPKNTQALAAASLLNITDGDEFDRLREKFEGVVTILIPDIEAQEVLADMPTSGSMLHRASAVMAQQLDNAPTEWECHAMAFQQDALGRCSPVGVLFAFKK